MKLFLATLFLFFCVLSFSQDSRLLSLYSPEQLEEIQLNTPEVIKYWETYLNKGWVISNGKKDLVFDSEIEHETNMPFNPFKYGIFPNEATQYIKIKGTDQFIIVYPKSHLIYKYNQKR